MTVINTNIGALHAHQYSKKAELFVNKALERLSSGKRINQASDDAAGLAVASKMTSQMLGMRHCNKKHTRRYFPRSNS